MCAERLSSRVYSKVCCILFSNKANALGFNCTIIAYGQTGSGKTFTMGTESNTQAMLSEWRGLIPRMVDRIFGNIAR